MARNPELASGSPSTRRPLLPTDALTPLASNTSLRSSKVLPRIGISRKCAPKITGAGRTLGVSSPRTSWANPINNNSGRPLITFVKGHVNRSATSFLVSAGSWHCLPRTFRKTSNCAGSDPSSVQSICLSSRSRRFQTWRSSSLPPHRSRVSEKEGASRPAQTGHQPQPKQEPTPSRIR